MKSLKQWVDMLNREGCRSLIAEPIHPTSPYGYVVTINRRKVPHELRDMLWTTAVGMIDERTRARQYWGS